MEILRFLFSKRFLKHLIIAVVIAVLLPGALYVYLHFFTRHGESVKVPDVRGLHIQKAAELLNGNTLNYVVIDSVYAENAERGTIFQQSPPAQSPVKEQRVVYLTIYRLTPPSEVLKVEEGMDERVAEIILENKGIRFEKRIEEHQLLHGMVVKVVKQGEELDPDARIKRGDRVTLVIGQRSDEKTLLPDMVGILLDTAIVQLADARLTLGSTLYDGSVLTKDDSLTARIYAQSPVFEEDKELEAGSIVDVFLSIDPNRFNAPSNEGDEENETP